MPADSSLSPYDEYQLRMSMYMTILWKTLSDYVVDINYCSINICICLLRFICVDGDAAVNMPNNNNKCGMITVKEQTDWIIKVYKNYTSPFLSDDSFKLSAELKVDKLLLTFSDNNTRVDGPCIPDLKPPPGEGGRIPRWGDGILLLTGRKGSKDERE